MKLHRRSAFFFINHYLKYTDVLKMYPSLYTMMHHICISSQSFTHLKLRDRPSAPSVIYEGLAHKTPLQTSIISRLLSKITVPTLINSLPFVLEAPVSQRKTRRGGGLKTNDSVEKSETTFSHFLLPAFCHKFSVVDTY